MIENMKIKTMDVTYKLLLKDNRIIIQPETIKLNLHSQVRVFALKFFFKFQVYEIFH